MFGSVAAVVGHDDDAIDLGLERVETGSDLIGLVVCWDERDDSSPFDCVALRLHTSL